MIEYLNGLWQRDHTCLDRSSFNNEQTIQFQLDQLKSIIKRSNLDRQRFFSDSLTFYKPFSDTDDSLPLQRSRTLSSLALSSSNQPIDLSTGSRRQKHDLNLAQDSNSKLTIYSNESTDQHLAVVE